MSLIPDRYECPRCGGYDLPASCPGARTLSSRCKCDEVLVEVERLPERKGRARVAA